MTYRPAFQSETAREFTRIYWETRGQTWASTTWLGVQVQKLPLDLWMMQEIIVETRPEVILECGTKFGGSALFFASVFDQIGAGEVVTIDVDMSRVEPRARSHDRI